MNLYRAEQKRMIAEMQSTGPHLRRKYWIAMALYAALAILIWFTMDGSKVLIHGNPIELRLVPLVILGGLALRTVLARQADRIRNDGKEGNG
jgi:hypothetical protein